MSKSKKEMLRMLATTADNMAKQDIAFSRGQIMWLVQGCVATLRKLGVSLASVEQAWKNDEADDIHKEQA